MFAEESTAQYYADMINASGTGCKDATVHPTATRTGYYIKAQVPGMSSRDGLVYTEESLFNIRSVCWLLESLQ